MMTPSVMPALLYYEDIVPLIPAMTSDSTPSGIASASSISTFEPGALAWKPFDQNGKDYWASEDTSTQNEWLQYAFPFRMRVNRMSVAQIGLQALITQYVTVHFQCSNDDSLLTWTTIQSITTGIDSTIMDWDISFPFIDAKYWRWYNVTGNGSMNVLGAQLYGYK